jgi:hypothetical protein
MILWVVYGQLKDEGFGDSPSSYKPIVVTDKTTWADLLEDAKKKLEYFKTVKATLDMPTAVLPKFTAEEIGIQTAIGIYEREVNGKNTYNTPFGGEFPTLLDAFRDSVTIQYNRGLEQLKTPPPEEILNKTIKDFSISFMKPDMPKEEKEKLFSLMIADQNKKTVQEFEIYQRILDANKKVTTTTDKDASGNDVTVTTLKKAPVIEINRIYAMVGSSYDNKDKPIKDKKATDADAPEAEMNTTKPKQEWHFNWRPTLYTF